MNIVDACQKYLTDGEAIIRPRNEKDSVVLSMKRKFLFGKELIIERYFPVGEYLDVEPTKLTLDDILADDWGLH